MAVDREDSAAAFRARRHGRRARGSAALDDFPDHAVARDLHFLHSRHRAGDHHRRTLAGCAGGRPGAGEFGAHEGAWHAPGAEFRRTGGADFLRRGVGAGDPGGRLLPFVVAPRTLRPARVARAVGDAGLHPDTARTAQAHSQHLRAHPRYAQGFDLHLRCGARRARGCGGRGFQSPQFRVAARAEERRGSLGPGLRRRRPG